MSACKYISQDRIATSNVIARPPKCLPFFRQPAQRWKEQHLARRDSLRWNGGLESRCCWCSDSCFVFCSFLADALCQVDLLALLTTHEMIRSTKYIEICAFESKVCSYLGEVNVSVLVSSMSLGSYILLHCKGSCFLLNSPSLIAQHSNCLSSA